MTSPAAPARGLSILVAEDMAVNRVIVQEFLRGSPHHITFAEDGRHAVELYTAGRFDLVLMDMQMPVMDGLEATRAIRAVEARDGRVPTPVIALTASTDPEDIEHSREAGCTAHLSKPIAKAAFLAVVGQAAGEAAPEAVDEHLVEVPDGLEELAPGYLEARRRDVQNAQTLLAAGDFAALRRLGHNMAGSGGSYGFPRLSELAAELDRAARAQDAVASRQHLAALGDYLSRVRLRT